ncbi:hypothetical protein H6758_01935 [Candidatus Nomurabacteria bacterium]|nr:hypothetical protein [Candidatus Nomurabacteria bacterium]
MKLVESRMYGCNQQLLFAVFIITQDGIPWQFLGLHGGSQILLATTGEGMLEDYGFEELIGGKLEVQTQFVTSPGPHCRLVIIHRHGSTNVSLNSFLRQPNEYARLFLKTFAAIASQE